MRVLIAPDCFTGTLTAGEAAGAIAEGWRTAAPDDVLELCALSDGGPGFVGVLHSALGGDLLPVTVRGPLGDDVPATLLLVDGTAYVESAQACGLHLVPPDRRDPTRTTTFGVGQLVQAAVATGARRVVVGLGGSAATDGGAGMLAALGAGDARVLAGGGAALTELDDDALAGLADVRLRLGAVELIAASDVDVPLLGFQGVGLDQALQRFAQVALDTLGPDLAPQRLVAEAGAGAAGGLGFGLLLVGARREIGAQAVLDAVGFSSRLTRSGLVLTGEGTLDWQSLRGAVVAGVARAALAAGVPTVVLAGQVAAGRRELLSIGVEAAYAVAETRDQIAAAMADPAGTLAERARRVARTWSPRR